MKATYLTALLLTPLVLGGCLLPQPDTPPVKSAVNRPIGAGTLLPQPDTPPVTPVQTVTGGATAATTGSSGTLLPQPDTPPVGIAPVSSNAVGGVSSDSGVGTLAPTAAASQAAMGTLAGTLSGDAVSGVTVLDASGAIAQTATPENGGFTLTLAPGRYRLVLTTKSQKLRVEELFEVTGGVTQTYAIAVHGAVATVAQDVALTDEAATGTP